MMMNLKFLPSPQWKSNECTDNTKSLQGSDGLENGITIIIVIKCVVGLIHPSLLALLGMKDGGNRVM